MVPDTGITYREQLAAWRETCDRTSVKGAIPIEFRVLEDVAGSHLRIALETHVPDAQADVVTRIVVTQTARLCQNESERVDFLRSMAHWFYRHECDEQFDVEGRRPFYPEHEH